MTFTVKSIVAGEKGEKVRRRKELWEKAFRIKTFVNMKEFAVSLGNQGIAAMRAGKAERSGNHFAITEGLSTELALVLTVARCYRKCSDAGHRIKDRQYHREWICIVALN